jgi:RP/EB family microtubule-associated protein
MKRVNWEAKSDFQFIENYKILQAAFTKQRVQKRIDVDRLIRAKYQDNLEFCQWLKAFFEHASSYSREDYDPVARRMLGKGGKKLDEMFLPRSTSKNILPSSAAMASGKQRTARPSSGASVASVRSTSSRPKSASVRPSTIQPLREINMKKSITPPESKEAEKLQAQNDELTQKNSQLRRKLAETELILENVEKERGMNRLIRYFLCNVYSLRCTHA